MDLKILFFVKLCNRKRNTPCFTHGGIYLIFIRFKEDIWKIFKYSSKQEFNFSVYFASPKSFAAYRKIWECILRREEYRVRK